MRAGAQAERCDCAAHLQDLEVEFGADILQRSAVWLTIKESRASFAIEHEEQHVDRVRRFASVLESRCGRYENPLSVETLTELQSEILGDLAAVVRTTIEQEMRKEAGHILSLRTARQGIKEVLEGPDVDIDRIIRSIRDNGGKVSNKLRKEFSALLDEVVANSLVDAIEEAFR